MTKFIVDPVIGGGGITTNAIPTAASVGAGTQYWDSTIGTGVMLTSDGTTWNQYSSIRPLIQTAIPMGVPSTGTLSAAGALSGITAAPSTYANCYMFFPANAIATVSAAGMYFVQMSSTTAGTVFQNTYTSGTPTVPATSALVPCTTASNYTQTTGSALTVLSQTVLGNSLGANGAIVVHNAIWTYNNSAGTKALVIKYSTANIQNGTGTTTTALLAPVHAIQNRGATNAQFSMPGVQVPGFTATAAVYSAIDSTADQTLAATINLNTATDNAWLESLVITLCPQA